jgi:hypothetical protein
MPLRTPGFNAEVSIYQIDNHYRLTSILAVQGDRRSIVPQQMYCYESGSDICCCMWGVCQCRRRPDLLWQ